MTSRLDWRRAKPRKPSDNITIENDSLARRAAQAMAKWRRAAPPATRRKIDRALQIEEGRR